MCNVSKGVRVDDRFQARLFWIRRGDVNEAVDKWEPGEICRNFAFILEELINIVPWFFEFFFLICDGMPVLWIRVARFSIEIKQVQINFSK